MFEKRINVEQNYRELTIEEIEHVAGGDMVDSEITVTLHRDDGSASTSSLTMAMNTTNVRSVGFTSYSGGIIIPITPVDSDGDAIPDGEDQNPGEIDEIIITGHPDKFAVDVSNWVEQNFQALLGAMAGRFGARWGIGAVIAGSATAEIAADAVYRYLTAPYYGPYGPVPNPGEHPDW